MKNLETIVALSTPNGIGAIGMIRISGKKTFEIIKKVFKGKDISLVDSHTLHLGFIKDENNVLDEVLIGVFRNPNSYTGEDLIEISCHGSNFIIQAILDLLIRNGARAAGPGEFTLRAFLNGKMDLSQSEAVSDLIASESKAMHQIAIQQLRGGFSSELKKLRQELLDFASLLELELDFSEEDVEFANRDKLIQLLSQLLGELNPLIESFALGNALKKGVPIVIAGKPNAGKSTLLNSLVNESRALVSQIPGTTRDSIEVELNINGILFRFIDTAGLRSTQDEVENLGIKRTYEEMEKASIILYLMDALNGDYMEEQKEIEGLKSKNPDSKFILLVNKMDQLKSNEDMEKWKDSFFISAKEKTNLNQLKEEILKTLDQNRINSGATIITNSRHLDALKKTREAVHETLKLCKEKNSGELLAFEIKEALYHLGEITGEVSNDELLGNIFGRFCIGK